MIHSRLSAHLLVQPASHHHWDIEVSLNGLISLAKAVHLPCTSGALRGREKAEDAVRCDARTYRVISRRSRSLTGDTTSLTCHLRSNS